jgi:eukaryotic-like serine/threonine-protein kinase
MAHAGHPLGPAPWTRLRTIRCNAHVEVIEADAPNFGRVLVKRFETGSRTDDPLGHARFLREGRIGELINHPGTARLLARGDDWLAFEWLSPSLNDEGVRERHCDPAAMTALIGTLVATLAHCHALGIVHRDVKPGNVMFRGDGPVLVDFGAAAIAEDDLAALETIGSPAWLAPELLRPGRATPAADIWSLAALAAWLESGIPLYAGLADKVIAERLVGRAPRLAAGVFGGLEERCRALLLRGLDVEAARPTAAEIAVAFGSAPAIRR